MKKTNKIAVAALFAGCAALFAGCCSSPDLSKGYVEAKYSGNGIRLYANPLAYEVLKDGKVVVGKTEIGLVLDGKKVGPAAQFLKASSRKLSGSVNSPVYKKASVDLSGCETYADFGDFAVRLVARADGVAYRFETKGAATIDFEDSPVTIPALDARVWLNRTDRFGCEETVPEFWDAAKMHTDGGRMIYLPFVYSVNGAVVAVTESNVKEFPIWNFKKVTKKDGALKLDAVFEGYPKKTQRYGGWGEKKLDAGGRWVRIEAHEKYLVKADGPRELPWRTFILANTPAELCQNDIVFALADPQAEDADFSWVRPGKVAWDWWNGFDNQGDAGCNTKTYRRFIDFAARTGVEYVIFDEGWSAELNIWEYSKSVDVPGLIKYANEKGVGIILWMAWAQVYGEEEKVASHFAKLGAKGFKVDFMDRGDAEMASFLEKFAAACAKHKMLVDYHGVYRPVGLHRKYPNILNYEGIHGLEQMKWGAKGKDMTYNDVACFFLRMSAGPMDYTPGAMLNYRIGNYQKSYVRPGSVGTRVRQMALMALYEAPLQMLCDSPTNYEKNMECFTFMSRTPVVWDDTIGLGGTPETFVAAARKAKDGSWYAAGMTNRDAREYVLDTSFLGRGEWKAEIFRDAPESSDKPEAYVHECITVKAGAKILFKMAAGGGFVVRFSR